MRKDSEKKDSLSKSEINFWNGLPTCVFHHFHFHLTSISPVSGTSKFEENLEITDPKTTTTRKILKNIMIS